ncbi:putative chromatin regulator PHD family [Helianthus annuus]|nr:putative chromatin regulator PHD family [Helianthus annuus]
MVINILFCLSVLLPIIRIKTELFNLLKNSFLYIFRYDDVYLHRHESDISMMDLPIIRFEDLQERRHREVEEMCFVCSNNYEGNDVVCQLSRCGHVFHTECIGKLIHSKQADCPFCRTSFFSGLPSVSCKNFDSSPIKYYNFCLDGW